MGFKNLLLFICLAGLMLACDPGDPTITVEATQAVPGDEVCVAVSAKHLGDILGMQYTVSWDETVLEFVRTDKYGLPSMSEANFGRPSMYPERLTFSWIDPSLAAVAIEDEQRLFSICFEVVGEPGTFSAVSITDDPTVIEVVDSDENIIDIITATGEVKVN